MIHATLLHSNLNQIRVLEFQDFRKKKSFTKFVMPRVMRFCAACKRPSCVRNAAHRAEPITVPL